MEVVTSVAELRRWRVAQLGSVGLVPTMGYLHEGHLTLVRCARAQNERVAVSIFANPTQFGPGEDFTRYPRDLPRDLALLEREGVDLVFAPPVEEVYPPGFSTTVVVNGVSERLEGAARLGHFAGVATIVTKLFNLFQPQRAYFGRKDAQQLVVLQKLVRDLNLPIEIVPVQTVRDDDGLALSSRNVYLSPDERRRAVAIPAALFEAAEAFARGERDAETLRRLVRQRLAAVPGLEIDYVSLADAGDLRELQRVDGNAILSVAVRVGRTRLIDNVSLDGDDVRVPSASSVRWSRHAK